MPADNGYPDLEALKAALSERIAAIMIADPEDAGSSTRGFVSTRRPPTTRAHCATAIRPT